MCVRVLLGEEGTRGANLFELVSFAENVGPEREGPRVTCCPAERNRGWSVPGGHFLMDILIPFECGPHEYIIY